MEKMGTRRRVIVDTDALVDVLGGAGKTVAFVARLEDEGFMLATTVINAFELYYGAYKSKKVQRNLAVVRELLSRMVVLKINERSAEKAGQIYAELEAEGRPIDLRDVLIGAVAVTEGYTLVTRNIAHFRRIRGF